MGTAYSMIVLAAALTMAVSASVSVPFMKRFDLIGALVSLVADSGTYLCY